MSVSRLENGRCPKVPGWNDQIFAQRDQRCLNSSRHRAPAVAGYEMNTSGGREPFGGDVPVDTTALNPSLVPAFALPPGYSRLKVVRSLNELVSTPFEDGINALCWPRALPGDFRAVVEALGAGEGIVTVDESCLHRLPLSDAGKTARDTLLADQQMLRACDLQPNLDCVHGSLREEPEGLFHTDVHSWHIDTATAPADTFLCTYVGATSEGLRNEAAQRRVDIPETRAELLRLYGGSDDAGFLEYLADFFYDLHYAPLPQAQPFSLSELATSGASPSGIPTMPVPPCVSTVPR